MPSFHKLVKTNEVGMVLLEELDRNSAQAQALLEATKQASECVPEGILPEPDLKTMRQVFEDEVEKTAIIDAFEPYRNKANGSDYTQREYAIYSVNPDSVTAFSSTVIVNGVDENGEVSDTDMVNSSKILFINQEWINQTVFETVAAEGSTTEMLEVLKVFRTGIYMFAGEYTMRILPEDYKTSSEYNDNGFNNAPIETLLLDENAEVKYRITLQQYIGGNGPYDEVPFTVIDNIVLAEGSFSMLDIAKGVSKVTPFNKLVRANQQDRFQIVVERSRSVCTYQTGTRDALHFVKSGVDSYDPYGSQRDPSNYIQCILLVDDDF